MTRRILSLNAGIPGARATARKHAILVDGELWTKRGIARYLRISDSTVRDRIKRVWKRGDRLTIRGLGAMRPTNEDEK